MSGSLHKKKLLLKQNQTRLSNAKLTSCNIPLTKINCYDFPLPDKTSRKNNKTKTTRRHQMSVESILNHRIKEPYTLRSIQLDKSQKDKTKQRKKKKQIEVEHKFNIPVFDFSRSNSLIVFSEKQSTINHNQHREKVLPRPVTPHHAATLIQKTWRGYLTRKLLDQYIYDEENRISSVMNHLKSRQESFFMERPEEINFSQYSSIPEDTLLNQKEIQWTNGKMKGAITTEHASNSRGNKQSPTITRSFFKNHKTQTDLDQSKLPQPFTSSSSRKAILEVCSSVVNVYHECKNNSPSLPETIDSLKDFIQNEWNNAKKTLKEHISLDRMSLEEMAGKSARVKQIYDNSRQFLDNVLLELKAIIEDMQTEIQLQCKPPSFIIPSFEPKSQMFTLEIEEVDNQPKQFSSQQQHFSQGQLKLQNYLSDLLEDFNNTQDINELEYLCQVIKFNSQKGVKTIIERCLLQFTVQVITSNYSIQSLQNIVKQITFNNSESELFVVKWINQLNKWEMGTIQEVTQNMQSSSFINGSLNRSSQYTE